MNKKLILSFLIFLLCSFILTGCNSNSNSENKKIKEILNLNKTMTCTKEEIDEEGFKSIETMDIIYNSNKVLKVNSISITESDPEYIDMQLGFGNVFAEKFNELDGINMKYEKTENNEIKLTTNIDYNKLNTQQIKETLGDLYDESSSNIYSSNSYTIEQFKTDNLNGYTCN